MVVILARVGPIPCMAYQSFLRLCIQEFWRETWAEQLLLVLAVQGKVARSIFTFKVS